MKIRISDIVWGGKLPAESELPTEIIVNDSEIEPELGILNFLIKRFGHCVNGYKYEMVESCEATSLPPSLVDCIKRTLFACREALEEPLRQKLFKAQKANLWLTNLEGWVPEEK